MVHIIYSFFKRKKNDMEKSRFLISLFLILLLPYANANLSEPKAKKHFVLVHTVGHGAWSWYKIIALMRSSGHNVTALDLGASGINPKQALEVRHISDYFSPLMEFMASLPAHEKVVLVGHSIGGLAIANAMETFPEKIAVAVFVAALMPGPNLNATTLYIQDFAPATRVARPIPIRTNDVSKETVLSSKRYGSVRATRVARPLPIRTNDVSEEIVLSSKRYGSVRATKVARPLPIRTNDVSEETVLSSKRYGSVRATKVARPLPIRTNDVSKETVLSSKRYGSVRATRVARPLPIRTNDVSKETVLSSKRYESVRATKVARPLPIRTNDVFKETVLSSKRYGSVRRVFIVVVEDKVLKKEFQQLMIEKNPPDEVKEIQGSDHMVMMSKPHQLFTLLISMANKYS